MDKLKPCPFCGGKVGIHSTPAIFSEGDMYRAFCVERPCKVQPATLYQNTEEKAIAAWNNRPDIRRETSEKCAEIARKQAWSHACEGFENGPELNSDAIYKDIRALADKAVACSVCGNKWPREQYEELRPVDASDGWCPSCGEAGGVEEE